MAKKTVDELLQEKMKGSLFGEFANGLRESAKDAGYRKSELSDAFKKDAKGFEKAQKRFDNLVATTRGERQTLTATLNTAKADLSALQSATTMPPTQAMQAQLDAAQDAVTAAEQKLKELETSKMGRIAKRVDALEEANKELGKFQKAKKGGLVTDKDLVKGKTEKKAFKEAEKNVAKAEEKLEKLLTGDKKPKALEKMHDAAGATKKYNGLFGKVAGLGAGGAVAANFSLKKSGFPMVAVRTAGVGAGAYLMASGLGLTGKMQDAQTGEPMEESMASRFAKVIGGGALIAGSALAGGMRLGK